MKNLSLKNKFTIAAILLIIIVIFLGVMNIVSNYHHIKQYVELSHKTELSQRISHVLYELQKERGTTVGFLTDQGTFTAADLHAQRRRTNKVLQEEKTYFFGQLSHAFPAAMRTRALSQITRIGTIRRRVDQSKMSVRDVLKQYTGIDTFLLETIADFATEAIRPSITKNMLAYSHFLFLLDYVGLERAHGVILLKDAAGRSAKSLQDFSALLALKREHKRLFDHYASPEIKRIFRPILHEDLTQEILSVERMLLAANLHATPLTPKAWYRLISRKIDRLGSISARLEKEITTEIRIQIDAAQKMFVIGLVLVGLSLLAFVMAIFAFVRLYKVEQQQRHILDKHIIGSSTDTRGIITEVSDAFCHISGYTRDELIGHPHNIVRHPDVPKEEFRQMWQTIKAGKSWQGKLINRKKNGDPYWVYAHIEPLWSATGKIDGYYAVRIDISEMEQLSMAIQEKEQESLRQKELMAQQQRLAQLGEMIGMIAHQWRQPLGAITAVTGSMQLKARLGKLTGEAALDHAEKIESLAQHMSATIDDFRNYFKPEQSRDHTDYGKVVEGVLVVIEASLRDNGIALEVDIEEIDPLLTYESKLKQVVLNLIKNAEDALQERAVDSPSIRIEARGNTLCVTDNAGGIPEEILPYIFDPYFSTKDEKTGTGLGLYMSKMIIEEHCQGTLHVESGKKETRFCLELPIRSSDESIE